MNSNRPTDERPPYKRFTLPFFIVLTTGIILSFFIHQRSTVEDLSAPPFIQQVETVSLHEESYAMKIRGYGTILEYQRAELKPEVSGVIIQASPNFTSGGHFKEGEVLLQIDPSDYEARLEEKKALLAKSQSDLKLEEGKATVAEREWNLLHKDSNPVQGSKELALRKPQLQEKKAALEAAIANLHQAELNLEHTTIHAPFNCVILQKQSELGQFVNPSSNLATIANTDLFRAKVNIPYVDLSWINFPTENKLGSHAKIYLEGADKELYEWGGEVVRMLADVEKEGHLARVVIDIEDPLNLQKNSDKPPLLLGSSIYAEIEGDTVDHLFVIPDKALHDEDKIWLFNGEGKLEIRPIEVYARQPGVILLRKGVHVGEKVIISDISFPISGMTLKEIRSSK